MDRYVLHFVGHEGGGDDVGDEQGQDDDERVRAGGSNLSSPKSHSVSNVMCVVAPAGVGGKQRYNIRRKTATYLSC
jgi:hypothetical protein